MRVKKEETGSIALPSKIFVYRDGVGAGDISKIKSIEVESIRVRLSFVVFVAIDSNCYFFFFRFHFRKPVWRLAGLPGRKTTTRALLT